MRKSLFLFLLSLSVITSYGQASGSCGASPGKLSGTSKAILPTDSTPAPVFFTAAPIGTIYPTQAYLVVLHDSLAHDGLGSTIISTNNNGVIVPNSLGLVVEDTFSLVSFTYHLKQIKLITNALLHGSNSFVGSCCSVAQQLLPNIALCADLNSIGITDSSEVNTLEDVLKVVSVFTYGSVKSMSIRGLNKNLTDMSNEVSSFNVVGCTNGITEVCFAFDSLATSHDRYIVSTVTDITEHRLEADFNIYPNPATSTISTEKGALEIRDALGNRVLSIESTGKVDVSSLEAGIYIVTQNSKRTKLIIE